MRSLADGTGEAGFHITESPTSRPGRAGGRIQGSVVSIVVSIHPERLRHRRRAIRGDRAVCQLQDVARRSGGWHRPVTPRSADTRTTRNRRTFRRDYHASRSRHANGSQRSCAFSGEFESKNRIVPAASLRYSERRGSRTTCSAPTTWSLRGLGSSIRYGVLSCSPPGSVLASLLDGASPISGLALAMRPSISLRWWGRRAGW